MLRYYLHGFGSTPAAFRTAWIAIGQTIEEASFLEGFEHEPLTGGRRWFPFTTDHHRMREALGTCAARLEHGLRERRPANAPLSLVGHSQGGMLALELACRGSLPIREVVCFGAFLPRREERARDEPTAALRIVLHSSQYDRFVRRADVSATADYLRTLAAVQVHDRVAKDLDHAFGPAWLREANFEELSDA